MNKEYNYTMQNKVSIFVCVRFTTSGLKDIFDHMREPKQL